MNINDFNKKAQFLNQPKIKNDPNYSTIRGKFQKLAKSIFVPGTTKNKQTTTNKSGNTNKNSSLQQTKISSNDYKAPNLLSRVNSATARKFLVSNNSFIQGLAKPALAIASGKNTNIPSQLVQLVYDSAKQSGDKNAMDAIKNTTLSKGVDTSGKSTILELTKAQKEEVRKNPDNIAEHLKSIDKDLFSDFSKFLSKTHLKSNKDINTTGNLIKIAYDYAKEQVGSVNDTKQKEQLSKIIKNFEKKYPNLLGVKSESETKADTVSTPQPKPIVSEGIQVTASVTSAHVAIYGPGPVQQKVYITVSNPTPTVTPKNTAAQTESKTDTLLTNKDNFVEKKGINAYNTIIHNAFGFDGTNAKENSRDLQYNYIIEKPLYSLANLSMTGTKNTTKSSIVDYNTGRKDNCTAKYDSQGRLETMSLKSSYGDTEVKYSYGSNGEYTQTEFDKSSGITIETTYNKDGSIKWHQERGRGDTTYVTRDYTYSVDSKGNPVQIMKNDHGVTVVTTKNADGTYTQHNEYLNSKKTIGTPTPAKVETPTTPPEIKPDTSEITITGYATAAHVAIYGPGPIQERITISVPNPAPTVTPKPSATSSSSVATSTPTVTPDDSNAEKIHNAFGFDSSNVKSNLSDLQIHNSVSIPLFQSLGISQNGENGERIVKSNDGEQHLVKYNSDNKLVSLRDGWAQYEYKYSKSGKIAETKTDYATNVTTTTVYNKDGSIKSYEEKDSDGNTLKKRKYTYSFESGELVQTCKESSRTSVNSNIQKMEYTTTVDSKGKYHFTAMSATSYTAPAQSTTPAPAKVEKPTTPPEIKPVITAETTVTTASISVPYCIYGPGPIQERITISVPNPAPTVTPKPSATSSSSVATSTPTVTPTTTQASSTQTQTTQTNRNSSTNSTTKPTPIDLPKAGKDGETKIISNESGKTISARRQGYNYNFIVTMNDGQMPKLCSANVLFGDTADIVNNTDGSRTITIHGAYQDTKCIISSNHSRADVVEYKDNKFQNATLTLSHATTMSKEDSIKEDLPKKLDYLPNNKEVKVTINGSSGRKVGVAIYRNKELVSFSKA